jgi:hypothetical protein
MKTKRILTCLVLTTSFAARLVLVPVPAEAGQLDQTLTVTKVVTGDGPETAFEFGVSCDGDQTSRFFSLGGGESARLTESELNVTFADGVECSIVEFDVQAADEVSAAVFTSEGEVVPSDVGPSQGGRQISFDTVGGSLANYSAFVGNQYPVSDDVLCFLTYAYGLELDALFRAAYSDDDPFDPTVFEATWQVTFAYFVNGFFVAPPELVGPWRTVLAGLVAFDAIVEQVGWDIDAYPEELAARMEELGKGSFDALIAIGEWLFDNCGFELAEPSTTTTTIEPPAQEVTRPRLAG